ncbi:MAG: hypothetical protein M3422_10360, partial [Actinomycetota bacterium]|nr:hypothetical protein [Actinomycetota bacterium]
MRNSGIVACVAATALVLTACGSGGDSGESGGSDTITINVFGDSFSLPDNRALYEEYEKAHGV